MASMNTTRIPYPTSNSVKLTAAQHFHRGCTDLGRDHGRGSQSLFEHLLNLGGSEGEPFLALRFRHKLPIVFKQHFRAVASL